MLANRIFKDQRGSYYIIMQSDIAEDGRQHIHAIKMDREAVEEQIEKGNIIPAGLDFYRLRDPRTPKEKISNPK